jgi:hypothetical protein
MYTKKAGTGFRATAFDTGTLPDWVTVLMIVPEGNEVWWKQIHPPRFRQLKKRGIDKLIIYQLL